MSSSNVIIILLRPSLHCNTLLHFTTLHSTTIHTLHSTTLHYTFRHFTILSFGLTHFTFPIVLFHLTSLNYTKYSSHLQTYFQNNEPLHCPKEPLTISLHFTFYFLFIYFFTYPVNPSLV